MSGNVSEWCSDTWSDYSTRLVGDSSCTVDPHETSTDSHPSRMFRGGGFDSNTADYRSSFRYSDWATQACSDWGFRIVRY